MATTVTRGTNNGTSFIYRISETDVSIGTTSDTTVYESPTASPEMLWRSLIFELDSETGSTTIDECRIHIKTHPTATYTVLVADADWAPTADVSTVLILPWTPSDLDTLAADAQGYATVLFPGGVYQWKLTAAVPSSTATLNFYGTAIQS
jgi:hypothetical protein